MHEFFPGNYMRSFVTCISLSCGGSVDEIDRIVKNLEGTDPADNEAWHREWTAMAARVEKIGTEAAERNRRLTASRAFFRACNYYLYGERFLPPTNEKKIPSYKKALACFDKAIANDNALNLEKVEVPCEGQTLPGFFMKPDSKGRDYPVVIFVGGLDSTKESQYFMAAADIIARGMACLIVDTPGIGEALRLRNIRTRHDYEVAGAALVDYLETREDVDTSRIGLVGLSMGGYYAPRIAAFEKRISACAAWAGHGDYYPIWYERLRVPTGIGQFRPSPKFQILWVLGVETADEVLEEMKKFTIEKEAAQIQCPFLITHGEGDRQTPASEAQKLYDAVGAEDKTIRIFTHEEGGAEHCHFDNIELGRSFILDWFAEKL
ncbi:MAG: alpha/beta hydrolase [Nitrospinae bacterium]|nr:alpha/beta hydrolase [Nitrospinota bacterium]